MDKNAIGQKLILTAAIILSGMVFVECPVKAENTDLDVFKLKPLRETTLLISGLVWAGLSTVAIAEEPTLTKPCRNSIREDSSLGHGVDTYSSGTGYVYAGRFCYG